MELDWDDNGGVGATNIVARRSSTRRRGDDCDAQNFIFGIINILIRILFPLEVTLYNGSNLNLNFLLWTKKEILEDPYVSY